MLSPTTNIEEVNRLAIKSGMERNLVSVLRQNRGSASYTVSRSRCPSRNLTQKFTGIGDMSGQCRGGHGIRARQVNLRLFTPHSSGKIAIGCADTSQRSI